MWCKMSQMTQTKLISGVHCTIYIIYVRGDEGGRKHKEALKSEDIAVNTGYLLVIKKRFSIEQCNVDIFIGHAGYVCNILCIRSSKLIAFGRKLHLYTASFSIVDRIPQEPIYLSISKQTAFVALA